MENKNKGGRPKSKDKLRDFLKIRPHFKTSVLAEEVGIHRSTLNNFKNGNTELGKKTRSKLEDVLKKHGYRKR